MNEKGDLKLLIFAVRKKIWSSFGADRLETLDYSHLLDILTPPEQYRWAKFELWIRMLRVQPPSATPERRTPL
jgi:hypothetical protein